MPQLSEDRIHSSELEIPCQSLEASEVDAFLASLFQDVAQRPEPLALREAASVVRYLRLLAWKGVPRNVASQGSEALKKYYESQDCERDRHARPKVERLADVLWGCLSQWGLIEPCTREKARLFLRQHSRTYLAGNPLLRTAQQIVNDFVIPPLEHDEPEPFQPPHAMSGSLTAQGVGNPRLKNDLSERIYAAFHALKRTNMKLIEPRIAEALARRAVPRRGPKSQWTYQTVHERIKAYEQQQRKELHETTGTRASDERMGEWRDRLVNKWISGYRCSLVYPVRRDVIPRHVGWLCFDCSHVMPAVHDAEPPTQCTCCSSRKIAVLMAYLTEIEGVVGNAIR
jgi:hypothetical protein